MGLRKIIVQLLLLRLLDAFVINKENESWQSVDRENEGNLSKVFNGVYTECFLHLSYSCVQRKTLIYLKELGELPEVSVIGDYVKFVKLNTSEKEDFKEEDTKGKNSEDLSFMIDAAVDKFFNNHVVKFTAMGRDISLPNAGEEFVGRKKRKGGGGGGGGGGHGGGDGGKKKMMMMAMMCMKMKLMMMIPAMMGMMGMMSFKGMMFSMMSFMIAKMMLLMKLLEKKGGGAGGGGGGGGDPWQSGGGGGAWMPAGGDYGGGGGGGGGGYDANGQWQSRSIYDQELENIDKPVISYVTPLVRANRKTTDEHKAKSRRRRSIIDVIQNAYDYWVNRILGNNIRRRLKQPNHKIVNGIKYVYYPMKMLQKVKAPKEMQSVKQEDLKPIVIAEDFNKGEIMEGPIESRMSKKKFHKMKDAVNDTVDDNPWE